MTPTLFSKTPTVTVVDNRGLTVRDIAYHRHPDTPTVTDERITRHHYDVRGFLTQRSDPRLHSAGRANFTYIFDLEGNALQTAGVDNGITVSLNDTSGRPFLAVSNIRTVDDGTQDRSLAVTRRWQYEPPSLPGRPLSVTEQLTGEAARITERFVYAGNTAGEKAHNLVGQCICHYDTAGMLQTDSVALTGVPLSVTRLLLKETHNPDVMADWQGADASVWNDLLAGKSEGYTTLTTADASGAVLTTTDARGNIQRMAYDVAGLLSGSWLTRKGGAEQVILASLTYSAAGKKLREVHGNGVLTTFTYEAETQRLTGIKTERPAGHASGAKILQDLRYEYDPVGNVLKISNDAEETRFWRNQKVVPENTYAYDSLYQLVRATGREMASAGQQGSNLPSATVPHPTDSSAFTNYIRTYSYDNAGNLTQIRHNAPATGNSYTINITVSDKSNRSVLSSLTETPSEVDALFTVGGQQKLLQPGQNLVWTARNELLKVTPVMRDGSTDDSESYRYDGSSQRLLKITRQKASNSLQTQRVAYLPGLELRNTTSDSREKESLQVIIMGKAGRAQVRMLHWESGQPTEVVGDQLRYSYENQVGSTGLELDGGGNLISMEEFYPYGGTAVWTARRAVEADYKTIRYSGKERDATGLYYFGYRYYQPWAGRWLSADPAGTVDGLNLFRMVRNNPVTLIDNDGRWPALPDSETRRRMAGVGIRFIVDSVIAGVMGAARSYFTSLAAGSGETNELQTDNTGTVAVDMIIGLATPVVMEYASSFVLSFLPELDLVNENGDSFLPLGNFNRRGIGFVGANMVNNYAGRLIAHYTDEAIGSIPDAGSAFISDFTGAFFVSLAETGLLTLSYRNSLRLVNGITRSEYTGHIRSEIRDTTITAGIGSVVEGAITVFSRYTHPAVANLPGMIEGAMGHVPYTYSRRRRLIPRTANDFERSLATLGQLASPPYRGLPMVTISGEVSRRMSQSRRNSGTQVTEL